MLRMIATSEKQNSSWEPNRRLLLLIISVIFVESTSALQYLFLLGGGGCAYWLPEVCESSQQFACANSRIRNGFRDS